MVHAVGNGLDDLGDLLLDLSQFHLPGVAVRATLAVQPVRLFGIGAHRFRCDFGRHHAVLESGEHAFFQFFLSDGAAVGAGAFADVVGAGEPTRAAQRIGTATGAAVDQAG
ncbi:hypothetical protein [Devosia pacifica]|uniref:hypothetical protein n=1 Tax=Devosia pacifica TaxID=1335967 RepID=UPI0027E54AAD|nr:hypothetical protein [Devosia pacifica]